METLYDHIRKIARTLVVGAEKYLIKGVKIWFDAPEKPSESNKPANPSPTTDNFFKWTNYRALFSNADETEFYVYETKLNIDGKGQSPAIVYDSTADFNLDRKNMGSVALTVKEAERALSQYFRGPNLFPKIGKTDLLYYNINLNDKEGKYSPDEFKSKYNDPFYGVQMPGNNKLKNPVTNKPVGVTPPTGEEGK